MGSKPAYTLQDRRNIKELLNKGLPATKIAVILKKSKSAIYDEINRRGGPKDYDPELEVGIPVIGSPQRILNNKIEQLSEKVEMLEMQVEILHDIIKGMAKK